MSLSAQLRKQVCATNPIVFMDITIGSEFGGRVIIELRKDVVPKSAENFRALCTGELGISLNNTNLHYKGNRFHKITRCFAAQSGDVVSNDGTGGESIYGPIFEDENFLLPHEEGVVSMANYGKPNTNSSQFVLTSVPCENLNGTNVVVGWILRGLGILAVMEQYTTDDSKPTKDIVIVDCGEILPGQDWGFCDKDETEDVLPPYPQDWEEKFNEFSSDDLVNLLTIIRNAGNHFFGKELYYDARRKYRKAHRYYNMLRHRYDWQELKHVGCRENDLAKLDDFCVINNANMAAVELKLGEYSNAAYVCTDAIKMNPNYSKAYYRRGQAQIELKNYEEAVNDLKKALELTPNNKQIINELNRAKKYLSDYNRIQMLALKNLFPSN